MSFFFQTRGQSFDEKTLREQVRVIEERGTTLFLYANADLADATLSMMAEVEGMPDLEPSAFRKLRPVAFDTFTAWMRQAKKELAVYESEAMDKTLEEVLRKAFIPTTPEAPAPRAPES